MQRFCVRKNACTTSIVFSPRMRSKRVHIGSFPDSLADRAKTSPLRTTRLPTKSPSAGGKRVEIVSDPFGATRTISCGFEEISPPSDVAIPHAGSPERKQRFPLALPVSRSKSLRKP
jgi:hypothetical protein